MRTPFLLQNTTHHHSRAHKMDIILIKKHKSNTLQQNTMPDAGLALHSPSAELMKLVDVDHMSDFDEVVSFLSGNLGKVIAEVHGFGKLLIDNEKTQLNCPPAPEAGDSHGAELVRTLSEKESPEGVTLRREFKVHDLGVDPQSPSNHRVEIREDVVGGPNKFTENIRVVTIARG